MRGEPAKRSVLVVNGGPIAVELARSFRASGASVWVVSDSVGGEEETARRLDELGRESGGTVQHVGIRLGDPEASQETYRQMAHAVGEPSVLVTCLCEERTTDITTVPRGRKAIEALDGAIAQLLMPLFEFWRLAAPAMVQSGWGRLVAICSLEAKGPYSALGSPSDVAVHAAAIGLVKAVAKELATTGVTSNCVAALDLEVVSSWRNEVRGHAAPPIGRLAQPFEVADAAVFLASEDASYVTGETINFDGGLLME